jgi:hypothetical protein
MTVDPKAVGKALAPSKLLFVRKVKALFLLLEKAETYLALVAMVSFGQTTKRADYILVRGRLRDTRNSIMALGGSLLIWT